MTGGTGSNAGRIARNALWMFFDKVFILILNLLVTVRIANYYGTLKYGVYQYAVSVTALFEALVTFVDARVVKKRYITENPQELVWNATVSRMLFSAASLLFGTLYCALNGEGAEYNAIFLVLLVNSILINLRFGMQNRYEYLLKSRKVIVAGNAALTVGGFLQLAAVSFRLPVLAIACITAFASLMTLLIIYIQYRADFEKLVQGKIRRNLVKALITESAPFAVAASCAIVYSRCDSIMIGNMLSKEEVGIYAIAVKLIAIVQIGISPVRESVYPQMIELYMTNRRQYARKYVQITSLLTWFYIIGAGLSMLILPTAFRLLKPEYYSAFGVYRIYVLGSFFMYNAALRAGHFTLIHRGNILMISQFISVALNVVLNYFGIKTFGAYGAALATAITQGISLLFCNLLFGKDGREAFRWQIEALNPCRIFSKPSAE